MDSFKMTSDEFLNKCSNVGLKVYPWEQFIGKNIDCRQDVDLKLLPINSNDSSNASIVDCSNHLIGAVSSTNSNDKNGIEKNPISKVCEYCQRILKHLPNYKFEFNVDKSEFTCIVSIDQYSASSVSKNKKTAKTQASVILYNILTNERYTPESMENNAGTETSVASNIQIKSDNSASALTPTILSQDKATCPVESENGLAPTQPEPTSNSSPNMETNSSDIALINSSDSNLKATNSCISGPQIDNSFELIYNSDLNDISKLNLYCQKYFKKHPEYKFSYNVEKFEYTCVATMSSKNAAGKTASAVSSFKKTAKSEAAKNLLDIYLGKSLKINETKNDIIKSEIPEEAIVTSSQTSSVNTSSVSDVEMKSTESITTTNSPIHSKMSPKSQISMLYEHCVKNYKDDPSFTFEKKMGLFVCTATIDQYSAKESSPRKQQSKEKASEKLLKMLLSKMISI